MFMDALMDYRINLARYYGLCCISCLSDVWVYVILVCVEKQGEGKEVRLLQLTKIEYTNCNAFFVIVNTIIGTITNTIV